MKHSRIKHMTLRVKNIHLMTTFYVDVLGMTIHEENEHKVILGTKEDALLTLKTDPSYKASKEPVAGLYHVAYLLPERKYLAAFLGHLIDTKTPIEGASDHGVSEAVYLRDPEWNGIEVYVDRSKDQWPMKDGHIEMFTEAMDLTSMMALKMPYQELPKDTIIGHVHHHVNDIDAHEAYYQKGLGMSLMLKYGPSASFLSYDGYHHHLGMNVWKGRNIPGLAKDELGLEYVTLQYQNQVEIDLIVNNLKTYGYVVHQQDNGWYTEDPSGHGFLLVVS